MNDLFNDYLMSVLPVQIIRDDIWGMTDDLICPLKFLAVLCIATYRAEANDQ